MIRTIYSLKKIKFNYIGKINCVRFTRALFGLFVILTVWRTEIGSVAVLWRLWSGIPHVLSVSTSCVTSRGLLVVPLMHSWISSPWLSSLSDRYKSRSYPCYCCGIQRLGRLIRRIRRVFARAHSYSIIRLTPANFLRKKKKKKKERLHWLLFITKFILIYQLPVKLC